MSKSLGNVIDPLEVIEGCTIDVLLEKIYNSNLPEKEVQRSIADVRREFKNGIGACGSDSLRFSLLAFMVNPRSINLDMQRCLGYRIFCNKIWHSTRYALSQFPQGFKPASDLSSLNFSSSDHWILVRLDTIIKSSIKNMEEYKFGAYAN